MNIVVIVVFLSSFSFLSTYRKKGNAIAIEEKEPRLNKIHNKKSLFIPLESIGRQF